MKKILAIVLASLVLGPVGAEATELTWLFRSDHPNTVYLKLFADTRNHVWPNSSQVWVLDDYEEHSIPITCYYGEKICYGAWVAGNSNRYWGVGQSGNEGCDDCCYTCTEAETHLRILK